ncbi:DNA polymerase III, clamp loader complex, gamma/delta/delta subunit [Mycena amicta]|nr:DNA polymerase III, clamp loader complex, gamma/delta/delta subunit [Mycena amicta]
MTVDCPVCGQRVKTEINSHIDRCLSASEPTNSAQLSTSKINIAPIFNVKRKHPGEVAPSPSPDQIGVAPDLLPPLKRPKYSIGDALPPKPFPEAEKRPFAERLRPTALSDVIGQEFLVDLLARGFSGSFIMWGPSGCGKTTIARLVAALSNAIFKELSATLAGINDVKAIAEAAKTTLALTGRRTILFLDEIHRFHKGQQDIFLPYLERGAIQLIGAMTENPSFKLTGALLSRCRVFALQRLEESHIKAILSNALTRLSPEGILDSPRSSLSDELVSTIVSLSGGDARVALSLLEIALKAPLDLDDDTLRTSLRQSVAISQAQNEEDHYDMISALHKCIRGSQPDAALFWLARMIAGGEDPLFIARRLIVCSSEDIGLADSHALPLAISTLHACQFVGLPECRINLAHLVTYLSEAPKCTRAYEAYKRAEQAVAAYPTIPVPLSMRNAPTALMKDLGYGKSYLYNPDYAHPVSNVYLPAQLENVEFLRKAGDENRDELWDEEALREWEGKFLNGERWEGRDREALRKWEPVSKG